MYYFFIKLHILIKMFQKGILYRFFVKVKMGWDQQNILCVVTYIWKFKKNCFQLKYVITFDLLPRWSFRKWWKIQLAILLRNEKIE